MQRNRVLTLLFPLLILLLGCIEEYNRGNLYDHEGSIAVSGWINDVPGKQVISISRATPLSISIRDPLTNCNVEVHDNMGNIFLFSEITKGNYSYTFTENEVQVGRKYKLVFVTQEGKVYESDFEEMLAAPAPKNIYYRFDTVDTRIIGEEVIGLRFYTDFDDAGGETGYYKLEVWETYEFHTRFQEVFWMNNGVFDDLPTDSLVSICYITEKTDDIFLISGKNLNENTIDNFPLNFVSNKTQRLRYGYSPELRILGLSKKAYTYWNNQKKILEESGGLFETQPPSAIGNIFSLDDPGENVIGYFGASGVRSTRIFVPRNILPDYEVQQYCEPSPMPDFYMQRLQRMGKGYAFFVNYPNEYGVETLHIVSKPCFNCLSFDGSTDEKPYYWD